MQFLLFILDLDLDQEPKTLIKKLNWVKLI